MVTEGHELKIVYGMDNMYRLKVTSPLQDLGVVGWNLGVVVVVGWLDSGDLLPDVDEPRPSSSLSFFSCLTKATRSSLLIVLALSRKCLRSSVSFN
jgi:hypothetical protein